MPGLKVIKEFEGLVQDVADLVKSYLRYYRIAAYEQLLDAVSVVLSRFILLLTFLVSSLFFSIALGFYFGRLFGSFEWGFVAVGVLYLLLGILVIQFKEALIVNPIIKDLNKIADRLEEELLEEDEEK